MIYPNINLSWANWLNWIRMSRYFLSLTNVYSYEDKYQTISIIQSLNRLDGISNQIQSILLQVVQTDRTSLPQPLQEEANNNLIPMECNQCQIRSISRNERVCYEMYCMKSRRPSNQMKYLLLNVNAYNHLVYQHFLDYCCIWKLIHL